MQKITNEELSSVGYGFVTASTAKVLLKHSKSLDGELSKDDIKKLNNAEVFLNDLKSGNNLIAREKNLPTSQDCIKILKYTIDTLTGYSLASSYDEVYNYINKVKKVVSNIIAQSVTDEDDLQCAYNFFSILGYSLTNDTCNFSH